MATRSLSESTNLLRSLVSGKTTLAEAELSRVLARKSLAAIDSMKTQIVKTISEGLNLGDDHGTKYVVVNDNTLGYIQPNNPNWIGILHGSVLKGGFNDLDGPIHKSQAKTIRPATLEDFKVYRVVPPPHLKEAWNASAWDIAHKNHRHVFFEPETDTIRQCPQNYCLLIRHNGRWQIDIDKASTINAHSLGIVINDHRTADGNTLADIIETGFFG